MITVLLPYLQTFLAIGNLVIMLWALKTFLNKPHDSLADEVKKLREEIVQLKVNIREMQKSLDSSHDKHREQDRTNKVFKRVFILMANFEVSYCQNTGYSNTEDLKEAKRELEEYLAGE